MRIIISQTWKHLCRPRNKEILLEREKPRLEERDQTAHSHLRRGPVEGLAKDLTMNCVSTNKGIILMERQTISTNS